MFAKGKESKTNKSFFAGIFLQTAADYIANASFIPSKDSIIQNGNKLLNGSQLTKPLNLDGYRNARLFANYSVPLKFIKSVVGLGKTVMTFSLLCSFIPTATFHSYAHISPRLVPLVPVPK